MKHAKSRVLNDDMRDAMCLNIINTVLRRCRYRRGCRRHGHAFWRLCWREKLVAMSLLCALLYIVRSTLRSASPSTAGDKVVPDPSARPVHGSPLTDPPLSTRNHQDILDGRLRMRHRQQILDHYCSTQADHITDDLGDVPFFRSNALVSKQRRLLYCPVGKIASTFLTRFLVAAMETNPVVSPYAISIEKALRMRRKHTGKSVLFTPLNRLVPAGWREKWFLESLTRVLFVRCPFKRLWSAYVDKLLLPNPSYWQSWGQASMNGSKASTAPDSRDSAKEPVRSECGQSVTFSQFISFVLSDLHRRDTHIRPVAWECSPCYVNYDVIGHVETLPSDVMHVTQLLRWNSSTLRGVRWEDEHAADTIRDGVRNVFDKWSSRIARCMSVTEAGRRLWRVSQLRGFIGESQQYPFTGRQAHTLAAAVMERALLEARSRSRGHEKQLRRQVNSAFLAAYTTVSAELKEKIRKLYRADFQMFGYDFLLHL